MRILKRVLSGLLALVVLLGLIAFVLPREVRIERSVSIDAPPSRVFPLVNSFERFNEWSPWFKRDPNAKYTYEGPAVGVGAKMIWVGNDDVGSGVQTILESEPDKRVKTSLDFGDQGMGYAEFILTPDGDGTKVTWNFYTDLGYNPIARWFGLFFDSMIGPDYEQGLKQLEELAEKPAG